MHGKIGNKYILSIHVLPIIFFNYIDPDLTKFMVYGRYKVM
jgi:hypothetical protein